MRGNIRMMMRMMGLFGRTLIDEDEGGKRDEDCGWVQSWVRAAAGGVGCQRV